MSGLCLQASIRFPAERWRIRFGTENMGLPCCDPIHKYSYQGGGLENRCHVQ
jgi:hypothetical protein